MREVPGSHKTAAAFSDNSATVSEQEGTQAATATAGLRPPLFLKGNFLICLVSGSLEQMYMDRVLLLPNKFYRFLGRVYKSQVINGC